MNPSRTFILRPIATSLLMAAILLVGIVAYKQLPVSALPEVDYPTMQVITFYPGASPDVVASAMTAPLERQLGEVPGLNQMLSDQLGGRLGNHAAVYSEPEYRRRRAGGSGGHQRGAELSAGQSADAAGLHQDESGGRADPDAGADLAIHCLVEGGGLSRHAPGAKDLAALGSRRGNHQRRPETGGPHPGESHETGVLWA